MRGSYCAFWLPVNRCGSDGCSWNSFGHGRRMSGIRWPQTSTEHTEQPSLSPRPSTQHPTPWNITNLSPREQNNRNRYIVRRTCKRTQALHGRGRWREKKCNRRPWIATSPGTRWNAMTRAASEAHLSLWRGGSVPQRLIAYLFRRSAGSYAPVAHPRCLSTRPRSRHRPR